jgi:hypothetical protein
VFLDNFQDHAGGKMMEEKKEIIIVDGKKVAVPEGQVFGVEEAIKGKEEKKAPIWVPIFIFCLFIGWFFLLTLDSLTWEIGLSYFGFLAACIVVAGIKWGKPSAAYDDGQFNSHFWENGFYDPFYDDFK